VKTGFESSLARRAAFFAFSSALRTPMHMPRTGALTICIVPVYNQSRTGASAPVGGFPFPRGQANKATEKLQGRSPPDPRIRINIHKL
jgi:hypothetical protein